MKNPRDLVEAVGAWLHFELKCQREELFSERYMAYPIGQYFSARFGTNFKAEYPHPVLSETMIGSGDRPRLDFAVVSKDGLIQYAVETKWVKSVKVLSAIIRDIIRLELVSAHCGTQAFLVLGGKKKDLSRIFGSAYFNGHPDHPQSRSLLPTEHNNRCTLRLYPPPKYRLKLFTTACQGLEYVELPKVVIVTRSKPFPELVKSSQYMIYGWSISVATRRETFRFSELEALGKGTSLSELL